MEKKIFIVGQALPEKPTQIPFQRTRLYKWFESIEVTKDQVIEKCIFDALILSFPGKVNGKDRLPTQDEILKNVPRLKNVILENNVKVIIPVGKLAIRTIVNDNKIELDQVIGNKIISEPFGDLGRSLEIIPLPHPSGLSTWIYSRQNQILLFRALQLIRPYMD